MASGSPDWSPRMVTSASADEDLKISVTGADSSDSFANQMLAVLFYNNGPYDVHYNRDAVATTSNFMIRRKSWFTADIPLTTPHFICAAGQTATVYCYGVF